MFLLQNLRMDDTTRRCDAGMETDDALLTQMEALRSRIPGVEQLERTSASAGGTTKAVRPTKIAYQLPIICLRIDQ